MSSATSFQAAPTATSQEATGLCQRTPSESGVMLSGDMTAPSVLVHIGWQARAAAQLASPAWLPSRGTYATL